MIMFLVLNTAGITLIPTSVIAIRQSLAAEQGLVGFNGADIFLPTLIGTFISFAAGPAGGGLGAAHPPAGSGRCCRSSAASRP